MSGSHTAPTSMLKAELASGQAPGDLFTFSSIPYNPASGPQGPIDRKPLPHIDDQTAIPAPVTSHIQTAAQRRENAKARRRVPTSQRKRTKLSCDACKAKRCKCLRTGPGPGSDDGHEETLAPCKNCVDAGIDCVTMWPRKQRIYGSVEQLDRRYRALEALVSGLFPDLPSDATADELVDYGRQRGLLMPDLGPDIETSKSPTAISVLLSPSSTPTLGQPIGEEYPNADPNNAHFLKDTSGQSYYIGPSGSLASFVRIRDLIASRLHASGDPDADRRVRHLSSKSVTDTIARSFDRSHSNLDSLSIRDTGRKASDQNSTADSRFWVATSDIKLPNKELADACMNAFFDHVHPDFLLIHRPTFQQHYDNLWRSSARRSSIPSDASQNETRVSVGWLCCLYMIFILGSRSLPQDPKSLEFQRTWYEAVKELPSLLTASTLPNVCALMLLALYFQGTNDRAKSWIYLGAACRLAIALGLHRECANDGMEPVVREIRKLVWWTLYDYEQHLCCSLGRPSAIDDAEVNIDVPDDRLLQCVPSFSSKYMDCWTALIRLQATIRREVQASSSDSAGSVSRAIHLLRRLGSWGLDLPDELLPTLPEQTSQAPKEWRKITLLNIQHQKVINLLTRRFLLAEVEAIDRNQSLGYHAYTVVKLAKICVTSAMRSVTLLVNLWRAGHFNGATWLDTYYAYLASTQICLRLLEPSQFMPTAQPGKTRGDTWKFQPHEPQVNSVSSQPRMELDFEVEAIITQSNLVESYSAAQLTDAVRQIHDILKTVPMSGFSAKCEAIASEFGKAIGAVDGKPSSTLFGGHLGQMMNKMADTIDGGIRGLPFDVPMAEVPLFNGVGAPGSMPGSQLSQDAHGFPASIGQGNSHPLAMSVAPTNMMDYTYSGVLDANIMNGMQPLQQPLVQWDMVQPPEDWTERNNALTDLAASSMFWNLPGEYSYNNMEPPQ